MDENTKKLQSCINSIQSLQSVGAIFRLEAFNLDNKAIQTASNGDYTTAGLFSRSAFTYTQISKIFFASSNDVLATCSSQIPVS
ncbi:MAG: hypothetical protein HYY43_06735 [Deltaproteobacteria bacterium]|nr:hypothetical protein [Deltaproteobacteria bacterium]